MANVKGDSSTAAIPGVLGENTGSGQGVVGESKRGEGVRGVGHGGQAAVVGVNDWHPPGRHDQVSIHDPETGGNGGWFESKDGEGVRGVSHSARAGVVGINDWAPAAPPGAGGNGGWFESSQGEGVRGWAKTRHHGGVVGVNTEGGFGVYGTSEDGKGVVGESKRGVGVHGKGGRAAGFFEGNVEITGELTVQGVSIQALLQRITELGLTSHGTPILRPATRPIITVQQGSPASGGAAYFTIRGTGFNPGAGITIHISNTRTRYEADRIGFRAELDGTLYVGSQEVGCQPGDLLRFSASDGRGDVYDVTHNLWSNTFTVTCT